MANLTQLTNGQRRALQVGGVLMIVAGLAMFLSFPLRMMSAFGQGGFPDNVGSAFIVAMFGVILFALGSKAAAFGFMKPVSEIMASETGSAVEYGGERVGSGLGRGLARSGIDTGTSREVIKIKCRSCGYLESEDARFCSGCGQAV